MKKLTEMQLSFAVNKAAGMSNRNAAIAAGYSKSGADTQASVLMQRDDIAKAIKAAKKNSKDSGVADVVGALEAAGISAGNPEFKMPKSNYTDSKEFLLDAMNHKSIPVGARADYAKALLPYQHARIGEKGKKETQKEVAGKVSAGGGKFRAKAPPKLRLVG